MPGDRLLYGAFVVSAGIAGVAGALATQLAGVSDPDAFGPFTSFRLLVAVLLGGASYAAAGAVGVAVLGVLALAAHPGDRCWAMSRRWSPCSPRCCCSPSWDWGGKDSSPAAAAPHSPATPPATRAPAALPRPAAVQASGLVKAYGGLQALSGFDLAIAPGEAVALVGANGSGKTTALRALGGALVPDAGAMLLDGRPAAAGPVALAQAGVLRTLQRAAIFDSLTALETVLVGAALHARHSGPVRSVAATPKARAEAPLLRARALEALETVGLDGFAGRPATALDGSQRRRLMLAAALAARPRLLLLDEPSAGAAAAEIPVLAHILRTVQATGVSVVLVEHNQRLVAAVADRVLTMADGRVAE